MILISCNLLSQNSRDSTLIPDEQLKIALKLIETGRQDKQELLLQRRYNSQLQSKIEVKDSIISNEISINDMNSLIIRDYITSEKLLMQQKTNLESDVTYYVKKLKGQKRKTMITSIAGGIGMIAMTILLILK